MVGGPLEYNQQPDEVLLTLIEQQDPNALAELYDRHARIVHNLIVRIVRNPAVAEELLQEVFWQVWQKAGDHAGHGAVAAWLYRIARNKSLDQLRRQQARPQPVQTGSQEAEQAVWSQLKADAAEIEQVIARRWDDDYLRQVLAAIPPEQRQCLELAYFEGMSQRQIAEYTQVPLGTVKTRLRIGLEKLERLVRADGYKAEDVI